RFPYTTLSDLIRRRPALQRLQSDPRAWRRGELPRTLAAARRQADLPSVAVQFVDPEGSVSLLRTFLKVQFEALGRGGLVDRHCIPCGNAHPSPSGLLHPAENLRAVRAHAPGLAAQWRRDHGS